MFDLATLSGGMPGLTQAAGTFLSEAASICLEDQSHLSGVALLVDGAQTAMGPLTWLPTSVQHKRTYNDLDEATEYGACAVAMVIIKRLMGKVVVERSKKGKGFDYWLGSSDDDNLFQDRTRLEVSGIRRGSESIINTRLRVKEAQIKRGTGAALIAIVEFSRPRTRLVAK